MKLNKNALLFIALATGLGVFATFYPKTPDVRLSLCQALAQELLKPSQLQWQSHSEIFRGYEDMEIRIEFSIHDAHNNRKIELASCFYPYIQDDIEAETFKTPSTAYSSYPAQVVLEGKAVPKAKLQTLINDIMKQQGKELINKIP